ncbi:MAG: exopolysaccharide biosynthesis polyprenyl glycosylphosphotransferase [Vicinamibacteria bacterium]
MTSQWERIALLQDLCLLLVSLLAAAWVRQGMAALVPGLKPVVPVQDYFHLLLVFLPVWAIGARRHRLHAVETLTGPGLERVRRLIITQAWGGVALALILVAAQAPLNRSLIALFLAISTVLVGIAKVPQGIWVERDRRRSLALVVGLARGGRPGELELMGGRRVEVLEEWSEEALRTRLQGGGIDEVVVSPAVPRPRVPQLLAVCDEAGVPALVPVERLDLGLRPPEALTIGRSVYLSYRRSEPDGPAMLLKYVFDRLASLLLLVLTGPLLLALAAAVRLTSRGPALFVQQRGGLNGHPFRMLKLRTMRANAEAERDQLLQANEMDGPVFKIADDPRVTRLGAFLRRTSLDELPQLVNVLRGEMSLVGPRPLPQVETRELTGGHRRRLSMRPGMTGLWQVSGRNEIGFSEWMALDLHYVDQWSLWLDLAILLRTAGVLLSRRGAR